MAFNIESALRVATFNVRGLRSKRRQYQLRRLFLENDVDIAAVQETKIESEEQMDTIFLNFRSRYNICVSHSVGTSGGCLLFIRNTIGIVEKSVHSDNEGRLIACDFLLSGISWRVVCVYAPNRQQDRKIFFESLDTYLSCEKAVILLGDFNCVCNAEDRACKNFVRDSSALVLDSMTRERNLDDVGYVLAQGTHYTHYQLNSQARLDRAYVSTSLLPMCQGYAVKNVSFSDHSLVMFIINKKRKAQIELGTLEVKWKAT